MTYKSKFFNSPNTLSGDITISGSIEVGGWSEGYMGSATQIVLYPSDFNLQNRRAAPRPQTNLIELSTTNRLGANASFPSGGTDSFYAQKIIPLGFEAISAQVVGSGPGTFTCYSGDVATATSVQVSAAGVALGLVGAFSTVVVGNGTAYVTVAFNNDAGAVVFGGVINIRKIGS